MWKIFKNNDPPEFDPIKHDPNLIFGFLTYRGICYAKWIHLKSYGISNWKVSDRGDCLLYTSPSPRDLSTSRMPSSA